MSNFLVGSAVDGKGGLALRTPPDIFTGADTAAAETDRNNYFTATANAAALAEFQGSQYLTIILQVGSVDTWQTYAPGESGNAYAADKWLSRTTSPTGSQIATLLDGFITNADWRSRLSGNDLVVAIDASVGSDVWRTDHTALRSAQQVVLLLDNHLGGTDWRGTSYTDAQATDAAGALLKTTAFFSYDTSANILTLAVPDDYITPAMLMADSAAQKTGMRTRIGAASTDAATTTAAGLQSASDKTKLDGINDAHIQGIVDATSLSALQGQVTDAQIPAAIFRDAELTATAVRTLLGLTAAEVNNLLTGASISGQVVTFTQNDGSAVSITLPAGTGGMVDGVVASGAFNSAGTELTLTLDTGGTVVIGVPALLRSAGAADGYRPIFDIFNRDGTGSIRARYGTADLSWSVQSVERLLAVQASALLPIAGSSEAGWQVEFKEVAHFEGAAGNAFRLFRTQRAAAVASQHSQVILYGGSVRLRYNEVGAANNGNSISVSISSGKTAFSSSKTNNGDLDFEHGADWTFADVIRELNARADTGEYNFTASLIGDIGSVLVGNAGSDQTYITAGGADAAPRAPISVAIVTPNNVVGAGGPTITLDIDPADTLTEIRAAPTFAALLAVADISIVGAVAEDTATFAVPVADAGIPFSGGLSAQAVQVTAHDSAKIITATYSDSDSVGLLFDRLMQAAMNPVYRGSIAEDQALEPVGWSRPMGPATVGNGRFAGLSDTPATILPRRVVSGNRAGDALEFVRQVSAPAGIPRVSKIPAAYRIGAVLYLPADEQTFTGRRLDRLLTPGFDLPDFYGFSDGEAQPATGAVAGGSDHLSWIGGPIGSRDANGAVTSWQPDYLASHARDWIAQWDRVTLANVQYDIGGQYYQGGIWLTAIVEPPTFITGAPVALNFLRNDNTALWTNQQVVTRLAGLYWWNPDAGPARYQLLEAEGISLSRSPRARKGL